MPRTKLETWQNYAARAEQTFANGLTAGTTDVSGSLVVTHSLASAPRTVIATALNSGAETAKGYYFTVSNTNATGSTLRMFASGSGAAASIAVTASWVAWV